LFRSILPITDNSFLNFINQTFFKPLSLVLCQILFQSKAILGMKTIAYFLLRVLPILLSFNNKSYPIHNACYFVLDANISKDCWMRKTAGKKHLQLLLNLDLNLKGYLRRKSDGISVFSTLSFD
jgi:hypothetical protein